MFQTALKELMVYQKDGRYSQVRGTALSVKWQERHSPRVVIHHFAFRFDKCIVDDFHLRVDDRHPCQFQALLCVTLVQKTEKKVTDHLTLNTKSSERWYAQ